MEAKIGEGSILEFKVLTMKKAVFQQLRQVGQKEYEEYYLAENIQPVNPAEWVGYVITCLNSSAGEIQILWFIFKLHGTLVRIADRELFWILRACNDTPEQLQKIIPQIFAS